MGRPRDLMAWLEQLVSLAHQEKKASLSGFRVSRDEVRRYI